VTVAGPRRPTGVICLVASLALLWGLAPDPSGVAEAATRCARGAANAPHAPRRAPRIRTWLHACPDGTIRTSRGRKIRIEGLDYLQSGWGSRGSGKCDAPYIFPPRYAAADIRRWGFNAVQLFVSWQNLEPAPPTFHLGHLIHHYSSTYVRRLSRAVARFRRHGVAVVLSMMQARWSTAFQNINAGDRIYPCGLGMPAWIYERNGRSAGGAAAMVKAEVAFYQNKAVLTGKNNLGIESVRTSFTKAWQFLVRRFQKNRAVIGVVPMFEAYDILTRNYTGASSVTPSTLNLASFFVQIGTAIHRVNPKLLIFFTEQRSRTTRKWSLVWRPTVPNGVMTTEFYASKWVTEGRNRLRSHAERAHAWHYPFYVDEFDAFGKTRSMAHRHWRRNTARMLTYCRRHHISWALLSYGPGNFQVGGHPRVAKRDLLRVVRRGF
jgi:cellulase (glycosyl hydrolase family 5)